MDGKFFDFAKQISGLSLTLIALVFVAESKLPQLKEIPWLPAITSLTLISAFILSILSMLFFLNLSKKKDARKKNLRFAMFLSKLSGILVLAGIMAAVVRLF